MRDGTLRQQARPAASHPRPVPPLAEPVPSLQGEAEFPEPDGRYLTQIHVHVRAIRSLHNALAVHCPKERDTVTSNVLVFYDRTDRRKAEAPDIFVVRDHVMKSEKSYVVWEEGRVPDLAMETLSYTTRHRDLQYKRDLYAEMGIREYFAFDIEPKGGNPALIRFRLNPETGMSERRESKGEPLYSQVLGTTLCPDGKQLHLIEPGTGKPYPSPSGERQLREAAQARADRAEAKADRAEAKADRAEDRADQAEREVQRLQQQVVEMLKRTRGRSL